MKRRRSDADADVIVVGAGLAGLVTASHLEAAGLDVLVIEAGSEVGGRVKTRHVDGHPLNLGAELVGPDHAHLIALVRSLGLSLVPTKVTSSSSAWSIAGKQRTGFLPPIGPGALAAALRILWRVRALGRNLSPVAPWESPLAEEYDRVSFGSWLESEGVSPAVYELFDALVGGFLTAPIDELSLLFVLWSARRGGGPFRALENGSAMWIDEGSQEVALRLSRTLRGRLWLDTPATRIAQDDGVSVTVKSGEVFRARQAVVAVPLPVIAKLTFVPELPSHLGRLTTELRYGRGSKVHRLLPSPRGARSGAATAIGGAPIQVAWRRDRCLVGLATFGASVPTDEELQIALAGKFLASEAPTHVHVQRWTDEELTRGTYLVFGPGQLTRHGPHLREPHGLVHFAGADRSSWPDNMEGAVESGIDVARKIAA